jgi:hypothetical protein
VAALRVEKKKHQRLSIDLARERLQKSLHDPQQQDHDDAIPLG